MSEFNLDLKQGLLWNRVLYLCNVRRIPYNNQPQVEELLIVVLPGRVGHCMLCLKR